MIVDKKSENNTSRVVFSIACVPVIRITIVRWYNCTFSEPNWKFLFQFLVGILVSLQIHLYTRLLVWKLWDISKIKSGSGIKAVQTILIESEFIENQEMWLSFMIHIPPMSQWQYKNKSGLQTW